MSLTWCLAVQLKGLKGVLIAQHLTFKNLNIGGHASKKYFN